MGRGPASLFWKTQMCVPRGLILFALLLCGWTGRASSADEFADRLQAAGIRPDVDGLAEYLKSLLPDEARREKVAALIERLGSAEFQTRQDASAVLARMVPPPFEELRAAQKSSDAEIRYRARRLIASADQGRHQQTKLAALQFIQKQNIQGLAALMLTVPALWDDADTSRAARRALAATVLPEDADLFRSLIRGDEDATKPGVSSESRARMRDAAVSSLSAAIGPRAALELEALLSDKKASIRLAAARGLANLGERKCLPVLIQLLEDDEIAIRAESHSILRALTAQRFGFAAYDEPARRGIAVTAWKAWHKEHGATAPLQFPIREAMPEMGRILLCVQGEGKLVEIDPTGKVLFEVTGFKYIWGCCGQADGHRLAVDYERKHVLEYDANGRQCWRRDDLPGQPTDVKRLESGNTLISLADAGKVLEIDNAGKTVWEAVLQGLPTTAQRLDNGNTVVNLQSAGQVVELDKDKKVVWRLTGLNCAHTAQVLENGNVLVCEMTLNKVDEYDRSGKIVWSKTGFSNPCQAQRLSNGHTLVADERGLHEYDFKGQETWNYTVSRARFCRY